MLADLKRKASLVDWHYKDRAEQYTLFSRKGFTLELERVAKNEGIHLVGISEMG
jgi:hypothetical protein